MGDRNIICEMCGKEFTSTRASFRRHLREKHNIIETVEYKVKCMEPLCDFTCSKLENLRNHLETDHQISQEIDEFHCEDIKDFNKWKIEEEAQCLTTWRKRRVVRKGKYATIYYYCNRSGRRRLIAPNQRKRMIKRQGSCKIDSACTSAIIVRIAPDDNIKVKYYKSHYGHDNKVTHMPLPAEIKSMIASQLMQGASNTQILTNIKTNTNTMSDRISLITKNDINNIIREYNIPNTILNAIKRSHLNAANSKTMLAVQFVDGWIVLDGDESYSIKTNSLEENHLCKQACELCLSCVHCYSCTCLDFVVHDDMCKHIHKVCISENSIKQNQEVQILEETMVEEEPKESNEMIKCIKTNIDSILISDWTDITDCIMLDRIDSHLSSALSLITSDQESPFIQENVEKYSLNNEIGTTILQPINCYLEESKNTSRLTKIEKIPKSISNYCLIMPTQTLEIVDNVGSPEKIEKTATFYPIDAATFSRATAYSNAQCDKAEKTAKIMQRYRPIVPAQIILNS